MVAAGYALIRRKRGTKPYLEDPAFRSKVVSIAASGLSRRGVAAMAGISYQALNDWLERGKAQPDEEPYGSFVIDYERASRALEAHASGTIALTCKRLWELTSQERWAELAEFGPQLKELLNVLAHRYPEDWGTHAHRKPEPELSGDAWLERTGITHAQLVNMMREPPEQVRAALVEAGPDLIRMLMEAGVEVPR